MKKPQLSLLVILTVAFLAFLGGYFIGRNSQPQGITVSVPQSMLTQPSQSTEPTLPQETTVQTTEAITFPVNINSAGKEELMALPGIGEVLAERILAYREENGDFARVEDLMNVEGIGTKRMEELFDLVTVGG